jgi:hypothetical protein
MYRLFSRRAGWPNGCEVKYFSSDVVEGDSKILKIFVDRTGREILEIAEQKMIKLPKSFVDLCRTYDTWYLYEADTVITDSSSP